VPTLDDILRVRQPTTSILEYKFKISDTYFLFVDVGGQRSERRKWINAFENVTCMLFVTSLSDYDLFLSKEELKSSKLDYNSEVNRMHDSLELFRTLINWKKKNYIRTADNNTIVKETLLFQRVSIILFLNKEDLFEEKFPHSSLSVCFKDYDEANKSSFEAKNFIAKKFLECDSSKRDIYYHFTYALDRNNIETVVISVKDKILKYMLESMRL
jgi:hypothetical protein